jgi:hypothetical protein
MAKVCKHPGCNNPVFSKLYCAYHQYIIKKPVKIRPVSKKTAAHLKVYSGLRLEYLKEKSSCEAQLDGCTKVATEIHHKAGRGKNLNETSTWMSICRWCHDQIHTQMSITEAVRKGLRIKQN